MEQYDTNFDFNNAPQQQDMSELIPTGTIAKMVITIRPGGVGPDGLITQSKSSPAQYLDCEFTISSGKYNKRKFWQNIMVAQTSEKAVNISKSTLRAMLESARNINPNDASDNAIAARRVSGYQDFNGIDFVGKIGIDKAKANSGFDDKNKLAAVVTPDKKEYQTIVQGGEIDGTAQSTKPQPQPPTQQQQQPTQSWQQPPATQGQQPSQASTTPAWAQ